MKEKIQDLYNFYYKELLRCSITDSQELFFVGGKQQALEDLADILGIELEKRNLEVLTNKIVEIDKKERNI